MRPHAWLLAGLCLAPAVARGAPGFTDTCADALRKEQIDDLITRLRAVDDGCRLGRIDTAGPRTIIDWQRGDQRPTVLLAPRGCILDPTIEAHDLAAHVPANFPCPGARAALDAFIAAAHTLAPVIHDEGWHPEEATLADPRTVATALWLAAVLLTLLGLPRLRPLTREHRPWLALAGALFILGLLARFAVTPAPANWYGAFLPRTGPGDLRFGAGAAVLQSAFRSLVPWTADTAFALFRLVGGLSVPLVVLLVRRLGGSLFPAALAGLLLAFAPISVRLSASSSEHILAATLALAAWVTWLRAATDPSWQPRLLAVVLAALAALTRIDCLPQLLLMPLSTLLLPLPDPPPARRRILDTAFFLAALTLLGLHGYLDIVRPSHHPGPELHGVLQTFRRLFSQFWAVTVTPPHWLTPTSFLLATLGLAAASALRQWRVLTFIAASLALIFLPLGRNLVHDGLTGARYFVLLAPLLAISHLPFTLWLTARWPAPRRPAILALTLIAALDLATAQPAWHHETTFQAEHRILFKTLADPHFNDCTLWYVRPRQPTREPDLDCCLSPEQSPLALQFPNIRFAEARPDRPLDDATGCNLYYEGAICSLDPALAPAAPQAAADILAACARLRPDAHELLRTTVPRDTITPRSRDAPTISLRIRGDHD